jgi:predicted HNH restriction endonuclease
MTEKMCFCCGTLKAISDFYQNTRRKDGHQTYCIECEKKKNQERRDYIIKNKKEYYQNHLVQFKQNQRDRGQSIKIKIINILGNKCSCCGLEYNGKNGSVFDCHHRDPEQKLFSIASHQYVDPNLFMDELIKCDLVCKNCHALIHAEEY